MVAPNRLLKRQLSFPVSMMSQWWVRRSSSAVVILASLKTLGTDKAFLDTMALKCTPTIPRRHPSLRQLVWSPYDRQLQYNAPCLWSAAQSMPAPFGPRRRVSGSV
jgi:hypothetical protein